MTRYVDAEAIKDRTDLLRLLNSFPTADVQEVKHGHWEYNALNDFKKYSLRCSLCSAEYIDNYDGYVDVDCFEYCPNCGAKMDEEINDDEIY